MIQWRIRVLIAEKPFLARDGLMSKVILTGVSQKLSNSVQKNTSTISSPLNHENLFRIAPRIPFLFSFFSTYLKHFGHSALKLTGLLSLWEPLMCSKWGETLPLNFTEHFWHLLCARSNTVCRIAIVKCSYLLLSTLLP